MYAYTIFIYCFFNIPFDYPIILSVWYYFLVKLDPSILLTFMVSVSSFPLQKSPRSLSNSSASSLPESRRHLMDLDEGELFMELIRDVANELDIDVLCHKILVNVGLLTHADRGSLFLAKGTPTNKYLVAKLFDVTQKTGETAMEMHNFHWQFCCSTHFGFL